MTEANSKQVGGQHYKTSFQHWDLMELLGTPYVPAQVSKYVTRWKKKNGLQDLEKALHFLEKSIEVEESKKFQAEILVKNYVDQNEIEDREAYVIKLTVRAFMADVNALKAARSVLVKMIEIAKEQASQETRDGVVECAQKIADSFEKSARQRNS